MRNANLTYYPLNMKTVHLIFIKWLFIIYFYIWTFIELKLIFAACFTKYERVFTYLIELLSYMQRIRLFSRNGLICNVDLKMCFPFSYSSFDIIESIAFLFEFLLLDIIFIIHGKFFTNICTGCCLFPSSDVYLYFVFYK